MKRTYRLPELLALADIGHDQVERRPHDAERPAGEHDPLIVEAGHQDPRPLAFRAEEVFGRHLAIGEDELAGLRPAHAELVELARDGEPGRATLDDEGGDAAAPRFHARTGIDDGEVGAWTVGDPHLAAIEDEAVATLLGDEPHRHHVGTCLAFRHGEGAEMLARNQLRQIAPLLLAGSPAAQLVDAEIGVGAIGKADRSGGA